ncbi:PREDICTED: uncharacterized protein LOC104814118 [Tarenaya hassleriana]|uniref:uncharacterized protein LOC104814118 n=1 Tax=Tarenaya hassleriana TaxID=28532 RepID=UPI00053C201D|nr:PREDICTED: uncharacterized protein LOC104814118 [Tarenaya hassleriana]
MVTAVADDWTKSAMRDGGVVAERLLRLKEAKVKPLVFGSSAVAVLRWGIRQPRTRSPRGDGVSQMKDTDSAKTSRCSPSTPLSWSGGCGGSGGGGSSSPSAYADGYEATSRQTSGSLAVGSRSKIVITEDSTGSGFGTKRIRIKKTFAELKEEEDNLLKERISLKKEIASLRADFDEQGAESESLKRMKLDLKKNIDQSEPLLAHRKWEKGSSVELHQHCKTEGEEMEKMTDNDNFLLPDLNMMPFEDNVNDCSPPLCMGQEG